MNYRLETKTGVTLGDIMHRQAHSKQHYDYTRHNTSNQQMQLHQIEKFLHNRKEKSMECGREFGQTSI